MTVRLTGQEGQSFGEGQMQSGCCGEGVGRSAGDRQTTCHAYGLQER
ncbi:hypothetical protein JQN64_26545 [Escherichia coli]|nr:hypothetical protein [Escherichia coli]